MIASMSAQKVNTLLQTTENAKIAIRHAKPVITAIPAQNARKDLSCTMEDASKIAIKDLQMSMECVSSASVKIVLDVIKPCLNAWSVKTAISCTAQLKT